MSVRIDRWRLWCSAHVSPVVLASSSIGVGAIILIQKVELVGLYKKVNAISSLGMGGMEGMKGNTQK